MTEKVIEYFILVGINASGGSSENVYKKNYKIALTLLFILSQEPYHANQMKFTIIRIHMYICIIAYIYTCLRIYIDL